MRPLSTTSSQWCTSKETYLRNDQELRELRETNDTVEQLPLLLKVLLSANKLQRVLRRLRRMLVALLLLETLTDDLRGVDLELLIPRPRTIPDVALDARPRPAVV